MGVIARFKQEKDHIRRRADSLIFCNLIVPVLFTSLSVLQKADHNIGESRSTF